MAEFLQCPRCKKFVGELDKITLASKIPFLPPRIVRCCRACVNSGVKE